MKMLNKVAGALTIAMISGAALAQGLTDEQAKVQIRMTMAQLREAASDLHNAQDIIITLKAQLDVTGEDLQAARTKAKHADDMDTYFRAYIGLDKSTKK